MPSFDPIEITEMLKHKAVAVVNDIDVVAIFDKRDRAFLKEKFNVPAEFMDQALEILYEGRKQGQEG